MGDLVSCGGSLQRTAMLSPVTGRGRGAAGSGLGVTGVPGQVPGTVSGLGLGHQLSPSRTAQPVTLQTCPRGPGTKPPPCPDPEGVGALEGMCGE